MSGAGRRAPSGHHQAKCQPTISHQKRGRGALLCEKREREKTEAHTEEERKATPSQANIRRSGNPPPLVGSALVCPQLVEPVERC